MDVSATYQGQPIRIINVDVTGSQGFITFLNADNEIRVGRTANIKQNTSATTAIASDGTINS
jgi:hypothetical protein